MWQLGLIYLFLVGLVGSEENPGKKEEKREKKRVVEELGKVDRKEEKVEENNENITEWELHNIFL